MIKLDGQNIFDEQQAEVEAGSIERGSIEKTVAGLDGVLSIDLGGRRRKIKQKGLLRATNNLQMNVKIRAIAKFVDGSTHTMTLSNGDMFEDLRLDVFKVGRYQTNGVGITAEYEITYTQLAV